MKLKVKSLEDIRTVGDRGFIPFSMTKYCGQVLEFRRLKNNLFFQFEDIDERWYWKKEWLEPMPLFVEVRDEI